MNGAIRILLVDDEAQVRSAVREMLSGYKDLRIVGEAEDREAALELLDRVRADVIFSDIQMEGGSGFELAETVHRRRPDVLVVFLTGYADFALDGYSYGPVDFLLKPVSRERLEQTLSRVRERLAGRGARAARIGIQMDSRYRIVNVRDLACLEKCGRKVRLIWRDGSQDYTGRPMQELEEILLDYGFFRCHQSYIIPLGDVESIEKEHFGRSYRLRMHGGGREFPLSRNKYYELRDLLAQEGVAR